MQNASQTINPTVVSNSLTESNVKFKALLSLPHCTRWQVILAFIAIFGLLARTSPAYPQARKALTVNEISELMKSGVSPNRIARLVDEHGVAFELDDRTLQRLRQDGASEAVLSAVKRMSMRYTEERQQKIKEQVEAAKRQQQEEAKPKLEEKVRADEEKRYQAELARKKLETQRRLDEIKQRQQEEARRQEEESKRAEEQTRQQAEAEKARQEELRRQEETRIAEEKRRGEEEARRVEAERRKEEAAARTKEALIAKNKVEQERRRQETGSRMLESMKNGHTVEPTYNDGDFWQFSVDDTFLTYDSRALKGVYELRYSGKRFQVFRGTQRVTSKEGQIGVLLAMVGQGTYRGGQSLRFPLSVNQKWSHEYKSGIRGSDVVTSWNSETTVRSVENVTTPAGKFWALKLVSNAWGGRGAKATFTYYYSPQAKTIVTMTSEFPDGNRIVELVKFGSGQ